MLDHITLSSVVEQKMSGREVTVEGANFAGLAMRIKSVQRRAPETTERDQMS